MTRWGYIDNLQSVNCDCATYSQSTATVVNRKQWPTSSAAGYLMSLAPRKTPPSSQRGQRHVPGWVARPCVKDTREVQQWIGNNLCPTDWGWQYRDESLVPLTADRPIAPTRVLQIVSCVARQVVGRQGCTGLSEDTRKAWLYCSHMCSYGNGHISSNMHELAVSEDSDNGS